MGLISAGLFYGAVSSFIRYYTQISTDILRADLKKKADSYPIADIVENALLVLFMVLTLVSISMGKSVRNMRVNIILRVVCIIFCAFNSFILLSAYYKLLSEEANLSFAVTAIYAASYLIPPMIYDHQRFLPELHHQIAGLICYLLCIPMYQIVFQLFSYANIHDVTWGNRDAALETQKVSARRRGQGPARPVKTQKEIDEESEITRLWIFMFWLLANLAVGYLLKEFGKKGLNIALVLIAYSLIIFQGIKLVFSLLYWFRIGLFELYIQAYDKRRSADIKEG